MQNDVARDEASVAQAAAERMQSEAALAPYSGAENC